MDGRGESLRGKLTCHCLLVETGDSLVLLDTGFGLRDVADPKGRLSRFFLTLVSPGFREEMTAVRQIQRLGDRWLLETSWSSNGSPDGRTRRPLAPWATCQRKRRRSTSRPSRPPTGSIPAASMQNNPPL